MFCYVLIESTYSVMFLDGLKLVGSKLGGTTHFVILRS